MTEDTTHLIRVVLLPSAVIRNPRTFWFYCRHLTPVYETHTLSGFIVVIVAPLYETHAPAGFIAIIVASPYETRTCWFDSPHGDALTQDSAGVALDVNVFGQHGRRETVHQLSGGHGAGVLKIWRNTPTVHLRF